MKKYIVLLFLAINLSLSGATYYVSPNGSDSNPGTIDRPFATWQKLSSVLKAGDTGYIRGGTYRSNAGGGANVVCRWEDLHGTENNTIKIFAYPGEKPVLNLDNITMTSSYCFIVFVQNCSYLHIKGLRITGLRQQSNGGAIYGMRFSGSTNNLIENIEIDHLGMYGMTFESGSHYNYVKNCDVHHLADRYTGYGGANGFNRTGGSNANHLTFDGCRAWLCSDDGWDLYRSDGYVTIKNSWAFWNGYLDENKTDAPGGDGIGFKIGPGLTNTSNATRVLTNCLAADNKVHGFLQNVVTGVFASHVYNNSAYKNGNTGFEFSYGPGGDADIFRNNVSYANGRYDFHGDAGDIHDHNTWNGGVTLSSSDFLSLDISQLAGPRKSDGSLPDITFMHLANGSDLIDAGINVGLPFNGNAPDMGAYETGSASVSPPAVPVYVSSVIENASPSALEITYNLTLASIVPSTSSFSVRVNSSARSVSSVAISGTRVRLTLSSPVAYGDVVTVAYTAPSSNPIQTPSGGKAESFTARTVTNRVNPPAVPVFSGAIVENSSPSVVTMTYSLSLANIVPAASAFLVTVNSAARTVTSVAVSGTKVNLTLSSPVIYGNRVTVAYTKPSSNPLQTTSGGQAVSISAQTVTNNVREVIKAPEIVNTPPSVVVNYNPGTFSGFVGTINASGSYDTNNDNLTYSWKVPGNIPVSATNKSEIDFLAPILDINTTYTFTLTVSDGKDPQTKTVPVTIIPYKPELETAEVISVETSDFMDPNIPENIIDGDVRTMWSALGQDQWIILELNGSFDIHHVMMAFQYGQKKEFYFDILGSNDKVNWEPILTKSNSCAFSCSYQAFEFPATKADKKFRYVKLTGLGNSSDEWNHIAEIRIFGFRYKNPADYEDQIVKIYPNPAQEIVNIKIDEPTFVPDFIKIVSLTGKILYNEVVDPDIRQLQVPLGFKHGIYLVQMGIGKITMFTQKLIVTN